MRMIKFVIVILAIGMAACDKKETATTDSHAGHSGIAGAPDYSTMQHDSMDHSMISHDTMSGDSTAHSLMGHTTSGHGNTDNAHAGHSATAGATQHGTQSKGHSGNAGHEGQPAEKHAPAHNGMLHDGAAKSEGHAQSQHDAMKHDAMKHDSKDGATAHHDPGHQATTGQDHAEHTQDDHSQMDHAQTGHAEEGHQEHPQEGHAEQDHSRMTHGDGHTMNGAMSHAFSLNLPMNRNGSGTGWLPDNSPMYGYMLHAGEWMLMFHGNIFARYNKQDVANVGTRGDGQFDIPNWAMAMGQRKIGENGLFRASLMMSLDPVTIGGAGTPLLFQTGETWEGRPLVDHQHPHDLFSELSVAYTHAFSKDMDVLTYFGFPGEPALGPVAFMHRPSAMSNPDAPLGHHWQDATHILFGVATLGLRNGDFKIEGSIFNGSEPDEDRYDFDAIKFNSYSGRLSVNPSPAWALQVSHGFLKSPEPFHPEEDVRRTTASAVNSVVLNGTDRFLNSTLVWGYNYVDEHHADHSVLLESALQLNRFTTYGRYEWTQKSPEELQVETDDHEHLFSVNALTLGAGYTLTKFLITNLILGAQATFYKADAELDPIYGSMPVALQAYVRISPDVMRMGGSTR